MDNVANNEEAEEQPKKTYFNKVVLLGDVFVGKTSIALRFVKNEFAEVQDSTVGNNNLAKISGAVFMSHAIEIGDDIIKFDIWDTAGLSLTLILRSREIQILNANVLQRIKGSNSGLRYHILCLFC